VPCCEECLTALNNCSYFGIDERQDVAKIQIAKKYSEALSIYLKWHESELTEMGRSLTDSILAGIKLGEEADARLRFKGFRYVTESGEASMHEYEEDEEYWVFENCFPSFRAAFQYASEAYRISPEDLLDWLEDFDHDFDRTIIKYLSWKRKSLGDEY
jgi:hypothetical protein